MVRRGKWANCYYEDKENIVPNVRPPYSKFY